ncbi:hypothetical protein KS4_18730 [Poriferisphaera corsica]|uniref:Uncharacterized protein n=1 Tax=Poriferisphaera corsica TaxID=2528020 RepID=A0A517YU88_9BACT|nr:hypothetical protein KS4_18730 [Poriferisphaera corsica]
MGVEVHAGCEAADELGFASSEVADECDDVEVDGVLADGLPDGDGVIEGVRLKCDGIVAGLLIHE